MLLSYSIKNFHSFDEPAFVSLKLSTRDVVNGWSRISPSGQRVTTALAVVGANGAGKTSLIKALAFIRDFAFESFAIKPEQSVGIVHHLFNPIDSPTEIELEFDDNSGVIWKYEISLNNDKIFKENLYKKENNQRYQFVFKRKLVGSKYNIKIQDFGLIESEAQKVRPNVSLISWAKQYGVEMVTNAAKSNFSSNLSIYGKSERSFGDIWAVGSFFHNNPTYLKEASNLIKQWDFGLMDIQIHSTKTEDPTEPQKHNTHYFPTGIHGSNEKKFELPFFYESSGTQAALVLMQRILPVLKNGGISVIDEMEDDLHPHIIDAVLKLFHNTDTNPHGAQIVFTCHSPEILKYLAKEQVIFVEKNDCVSSAYRGDEIEGLKNEHNLYAKYMSGALGAVPEI